VYVNATERSKLMERYISDESKAKETLGPEALRKWILDVHKDIPIYPKKDNSISFECSGIIISDFSFIKED
jgi:hypothetical protein